MSDPITPGAGQPGRGGFGPRTRLAAVPAALASSQLDLLKSLFLGATATAFFYEVFPLKFLDPGRLLSVFDNWVCEVIFALSMWSLFLLMFRYLAHRRQARVREAFGHPRLRALLEREMFARDADALAASIEAELDALKIKQAPQSLMYVRVMRLLHAARSMPKKEGVSDMLDAQAQIDVKKLEASYSIVQFFIWAIPIWGFIGTVLGIADAVHEFSGFIQTAETGAQFTSQMRSALGGVTGGLAVAFNTTFLALVLVMPVMLIASMLQKAEEELLLSIEEYCLQDLLPRVNIQPGEQLGGERFEDHLHRIQQLSATWLGRLEPVIGEVTRQAEMLGHQLAGVQPLVKEFTDRLLPPSSAVGESAGTPSGPAPGKTTPEETAPRKFLQGTR